MTAVVIGRDLHKTYEVGGSSVTALVAASLAVDAGEVVAVQGRSGSGKSTLLLILGLMARADSGSLHVEGIDVSSASSNDAADIRAHRIGFVFQAFNLLGHLTAEENVLLANRGPERRTRPRARLLLERAGLGDRRAHLPSQLSGGEQQRVAVARALMTEPALLLADEPTGNLDAESEQLVLNQLRQAADAGCAVLVASHSDAVCQMADRVLTMEKGKILE
jgi:ABC-type lipoprotein export system ATPase subunit